MNTARQPANTKQPQTLGLKKLSSKFVLSMLFVLLVLAAWISIALGAVTIPLDHTLAILFESFGADTADVKNSHNLIVQNIRLPRVLTAILAGWILAMSGMVMQGLFQNALASPYVLGIASGASAGASAIIAFGLQSMLGGFALSLGAFAGGTLVVFIVYRLARLRKGQHFSYTLILSGVALGALFSAITTFLIFLSGEQMREIIFWIMGNLGRSNWSYLPWFAPVTFLGTLILSFYMRDLNALSLGESGAQHLGINPKAMHRTLLALVTLMTSLAVSVAGTIGFIGLITPHAMRLLVGPDHRILLPASALAGAIFLLASDTLARTVFNPVELPVGVLTAFTGAPFFILLLMSRREGGLG